MPHGVAKKLKKKKKRFLSLRNKKQKTDQSLRDLQGTTTMLCIHIWRISEAQAREEAQRISEEIMNE